NQHPFARSFTVPIEVVGPNVALVGIGYIENFAIWRKRDTVGTALWSRQQLHFPLRRDVVDAVKIQLAILQWREQGIGEISMAVASHDNVVWRIQALALPTLRDHLDLPVLRRASNPAGSVFAGVEPSFAIQGVAVGPVGVLTKHTDALARRVLMDLVRLEVTEEQVSVTRPDRPFGARKPRCELLHFQVREVLRLSPERKDDHQRRYELAHDYTVSRSIPNFSMDCMLAQGSRALQDQGPEIQEVGGTASFCVIFHASIGRLSDAPFHQRRLRSLRRRPEPPRAVSQGRLAGVSRISSRLSGGCRATGHRGPSCWP